MNRKRVLCVLLALALLLGASSGALAAGEVFFVAVNDSIPLTLTVLPYDSGSTLYVPYQVFDARPGGVTPSYNQADQSYVLFTRSLRLFFDLENNSVTDESGTAYSATVSYRNGILYLPLYFCASHFGLKATMLESEGGYPVLRFTTGSEVYDDQLFIEKAENLISYRVSHTEQPVQPDPQPQPDPNPPATQDDPKPEEPPEPPPTPATVYLAFADASSMRESAQALQAHALRGTFFLTAQEILDDPALVRTLLAGGHRIGLRPEADASDLQGEILSANAALDAAVLQRSLLALLPEGAEEQPDLCCFFEPAETLTAQQAAEERDQPHLLVVTENAADALETLFDLQADVRMLRETTVLPDASAGDAPDDAPDAP